MAVPEIIESVYTEYMAAMSEAKKQRGVLEGMLGFKSGYAEQCQNEFMRKLQKAMTEYAASNPEQDEIAQTLEYVFTRPKLLGERSPERLMLIAVHILTLPLIELLDAERARGLRLEYESRYLKRERFPVQTEVLAALKAREKA